MFSYRFTPLLFIAIILCPLLAASALDLYQPATSALFISVVVLWFTELIPLAATGLLVPTLAVLYGVVDVSEAFAPFGNQILFLFIGSFLLARAMQKHGWDKRVAYYILSLKMGSRSGNSLTVLIALICWVLSMWVSNTATCAMMAPLCLGLVDTLKDHFDSEQEHSNFTVRLLLVCAFSASIGGMATPVGSPPNLIALGFLAQHGIQLTFLQWVAVALPVSFAMLLILCAIIWIRYPSRLHSLPDVQAHFRSKLTDLGRLKVTEIQVAGCFGLAVLLWTVPDLLALVFPDSRSVALINERLAIGIVALACALILFILPYRAGETFKQNLTWNDAGGIDWGTVLLFGGGLCLGSILDSSGLGAKIGSMVFGPLGDNLYIITAMGALIAILMSEFSSNTASISIAIPIILTTFAGLDQAVLTVLVVCITFGASFGFMLPVSTPPNAIVYGTGRIRLGQMIRTGVLFDLSGLLVIIAAVAVLQPLITAFLS